MFIIHQYVDAAQNCMVLNAHVQLVVTQKEAANTLLVFVLL